MAKEKREKLESITTPKGVAKYCYLDKPDNYEGKEQFKVTLVLDKSDPKVAEIIESLDAAADKSYNDALVETKGKKDKKGKPLKVERQDPYTLTLDDDGEETGEVELSFKMNATTKEGKKMRPALYDAKRNVLPKDTSVYGGSILKVNGYLAPYYMAATGLAGVSLRLNAAQIIELVTTNGGGHGFEDEEGYVAGDTDSDFEEENDGDDNPDF